nr:hypothetical protein [Tanacetum cinerariifolium]
MKDNLAESRVHVPNVLTTHPTLMLSDNSLPEFETFYFDIEEKNSGSTTIHADISLPNLECFNFNLSPIQVRLSDLKQALRGRHPLLILVVVMNKNVLVV